MATGDALQLDRAAIVGMRLLNSGLTERRPADAEGVRSATYAGCADSMPRAAVLSLHARLDGVPASVLDRDDLRQVWGPRFSAYVVAAVDTEVFTLGRMPPSGTRRTTGFRLAEALEPILAGGPIAYREAGRRLGVDPNQLRYAALTGTVALHWAGSGSPEISALPAPLLSEADAAAELARRFFHVFGPATAADFAKWAGVATRRAGSIVDALDGELRPVETPFGSGLILASDSDVAESARDHKHRGTRLLPSGDTLYLLHGAQRGVLVPDTDRQQELWTSRVWPGAVLIDGEIAGVWRRSGSTLTVEPWRTLSAANRAGVDEAARTLPLPEPVQHVVWESA